MSLLRSVARVDVAVGTDAQAAFTLKEVYIYKPNDKMALMPLSTAYDANDLSMVTKPSVPAGTAAGAAAWKYEVSGTGIDHAVYLPEADVLMTGQNGGSGVAGDNNHTNRSAIVVGGIYKEAMNYYRIDFKTGGDAAALMDVLRNHRYNAQVGIYTSLHDRKKRLAVTIFRFRLIESLNASVEPAVCQSQ